MCRVQNFNSQHISTLDHDVYVCVFVYRNGGEGGQDRRVLEDN